MERLNYFNPYLSKSVDHEDQLTRAYMVLLKHSFHVFSIFFDYCRSKHEVLSFKDEKPLCLNNLLESGWEIDTQKGNPNIDTNWLLSVLITDLVDGSGSEIVEVSDRNARYDGIITFNKSLTIIIENKPRSSNIWEGQLNPSKENLSEDTKVYSNAVYLEWKEIIKHLNHLLNLSSISGYEKIMIEDFLSFIDENFPYLNPFDSFHLCKGYQELIFRRIQNLLKSIVINEEIVKYHYGWGFYIETPYIEIKKIGLIYNKKEQDWWLELSFYFGDTQNQAKAFYATDPKIDHLTGDWWYTANFHVSFRSTNLVWFHDVSDKEKYLTFWKQNISKIYQRRSEDVPEFIDWIKKSQIINITDDDEQSLKEKFYNTEMQTLNICPGFGAVYKIPDKEAEELDKKADFKKYLIEAIKEGLKIIGKDGSEFLKKV